MTRALPLLLALCAVACASADRGGVTRRTAGALPSPRIPAMTGAPLKTGRVAVGLRGGGAVLPSEEAPSSFEAGGQAFAVGDFGGVLVVGAEPVEIALALSGAFLTETPRDAERPEGALERPDDPLLIGAIEARTHYRHEYFFIAGAAAFTLNQVDAVWDYGDCFVQDGACVIFDIKGPQTEVSFALPGAQMSATAGGFIGPVTLLAGFTLELAPAIERSAETGVLCDGNGRCSPHPPEEPRATLTPAFSAWLGAEWRPLDWLRGRVLINPGLNAFAEDDHKVYLQGSVEVIF